MELYNFQVCDSLLIVGQAMQTVNVCGHNAVDKTQLVQADEGLVRNCGLITVLWFNQLLRGPVQLPGS